MTAKEIETLCNLPENVGVLTVQKERLVQQWAEDVGYRGLTKFKDAEMMNTAFETAKEYYQQIQAQ